MPYPMWIRHPLSYRRRLRRFLRSVVVLALASVAPKVRPITGERSSERSL